MKGAFAPSPTEDSAPHSPPPRQKKMTNKTQPFLTNFWICAPQRCTLPLNAPVFLLVLPLQEGLVMLLIISSGVSHSGVSSSRGVSHSGVS